MKKRRLEWSRIFLDSKEPIKLKKNNRNSLRKKRFILHF